jgi:hypothetical protein
LKAHNTTIGKYKMSENKQENIAETKATEAPKVEVQAEVKAEVKVETQPAEVKVEAPKNRLIDGAVDALNKKLDFRV